MRAVPFFAGCLIAAVAGTAAAQRAPDAPAPAPAPAPQPAPGPQPAPQSAPPPAPAPAQPPPAPPPIPSLSYEARADAAWRLYHEAFGALLQGKRTRASRLAAQLRREHAGHPAAALIAGSPLDLTDTGERGTGERGTGERPRKARREEPSPGASAELALFQTLHGLAVGIEVCVLVECDEAGAAVGLSLAGGAVGAVASLKAVEHITSGQRALLNSGTAWGAFNALMALIAVEPSGPDNEKTIAFGLMGGQAAGLITGALLFSARPTAGQVALASSGGQWGAALMALALAAATSDASDAELTTSVLVAADVGLGMGAYLTRLWPDVSRAQTLVIDAGGIVGAIGGGGLGVLVSGDVGDRTTMGAAALGAALGLGAAAYFTRDWGESDGDEAGGGAHAVVMPAEHGRGGLVGLGGTW